MKNKSRTIWYTSNIRSNTTFQKTSGTIWIRITYLFNNYIFKKSKESVKKRKTYESPGLAMWIV